MDDCNICVEAYKKQNQRVQCPSCEFHACTTCIRRYLLSTIDVPVCMNCKVVWKRDFLSLTLPKTFITGDLKKHREKVLLDRERALLPITIPLVEQERRRRERSGRIDALNKQKELLKKQTEELDKQLHEKSVLLNPLQRDLCSSRHALLYSTNKPTDSTSYQDYVTDMNKKIDRLKKQIAVIEKDERFLKLRRERNEIHKAISRIRADVREIQREGILRREGVETDKPDQQEKKRVWIRGCPAANCRGFLSSGWKCDLCHVKVCSKCHEIVVKPSKEEIDAKLASGEMTLADIENGVLDRMKHQCKPENVETAQLLAKDSKPCPKCASMIFKIEGCDQMFCTQCHTAFSWRTGEIVKETQGIHNPHYYEWLRSQGKDLRARNVQLHGCNNVDERELLLKITRLLNNGSRIHSLTDPGPGHLPFEFSVYEKEEQRFYPRREDYLLVLYISSLVRLIRHIQHTIIPSYRINIHENSDIRVLYLMNEQTELQFQRNLQRREKAMNKKNEFRQIIDMYITVTRDLVNSIMEVNDVEGLLNIVRQMEQVINYFHESIDRASKIYNCTYSYRITHTRVLWEIKKIYWVQEAHKAIL
jgi:hypothetical protein